jgi:Zn-dependent protease with chaperone function
MVRGAAKIIVATIAVAMAPGCAGPITQVGTVSQADVRAEQQEQLRLAAQTALANQQRVERIATPLLDAAGPLCAKSSPARRTKRGGAPKELVAPISGVCTFDVIAQHGSELNAAADGKHIFVETAMLRFASDEELSVVIAHEIAHNAMHHLDAQAKNALGGAMLGALADIASAAGHVNTHGRYTKLGAEVGAQVYSQDFEREADYVGLYIMAWAGLPVDKAAGFWRRMAVEHPTGILFSTTHPTTAERFVRLEQWAREVDRKLLSGEAFGPEMKDQRRVVASRPSTKAQGTSTGDVALATISTSSATPLAADAGPKTSFAPTPASPPAVVAAAPATTEKATTGAPAKSITPESEDERFARATIGAPRSPAERDAAVPAYDRGMAYLGAHDWELAKASLKEALRLDGSVAAYHAALGEVYSVEEDWTGAAAEYTAALLIDVDNKEYRARLKEARSRR